MIIQSRIARPSLKLNGSDYYSQLAPYFVSMDYSDNCDGKKADDLQIDLADRDNRFISDWMPDKGTYLDASIICERWFSPNSAMLSLDCGRFWIDTVEFDLPTHTVQIKASSIPTDARVKGSKETRGWEGTTLKDIANQIAGENKMTVKWESDFNPRYNRVEQVSESSLSFLRDRAVDAKLAIKVCRQQIIFFDEETYEKKEPSFAIVYGNTAANGGLTAYRMSGGKFTTRLTDTTKKASVAHVSPDTGELSNETFQDGALDLDNDYDQKENVDPDYNSDEGATSESAPATGPRRVLNDTWDTQVADSGAQRKAKSVVREANKHKNQSTIQLSIGNPLVAAGQTFNLVGVGQFDGKWFIESVQHKVGPMFTTELTVRECLTGY